MLKEVFAQNLVAQGFNPVRTSGAQHGASNDFSNVSQILPASEVTIPIGPKGLQAHSTDFVQAADSDVAFDALIRGAKAESAAAIDLLADPALFEQVRQAFQDGK